MENQLLAFIKCLYVCQSLVVIQDFRLSVAKDHISFMEFPIGEREDLLIKHFEG